MKNFICPRCHEALQKDENDLCSCSCGYRQNYSVIISQQQDIGSSVPTLSNTLLNSYKAVSNEMSSCNLDRTYFRASSAKNDLQIKVGFFKENMVPSYRDLYESVEMFDIETTAIRNQVALSLSHIAKMILKEYYGPLRVKDPNIALLSEITDLSQYKHPLDFEKVDYGEIDQIATVSLTNTVGGAMGQSLENAYDSGNLHRTMELTTRLYENSEDKEARKELNQVGVEIAADLLVNAVSSATEAIGQNMDAISEIREVDQQMDQQILEMNHHAEKLSIQMQQLNKYRKLYAKERSTLDYCVVHGLMPQFQRLLESEEYVSYKSGRRTLDVCLERMELEREIFNTPVTLSHWVGLLPGSMRFRYVWRKKTRNIDPPSRDKYVQCLKTLKQKFPRSMSRYILREEQEYQEYLSFEKAHRPSIESLESHQGLKMSMKDFTKVLRIIKNKIDQ
ncbi:hypothetical protein K5X82_03270 [Halosquirtibacter xylanolyticus]|uniref:hypothetical protein n=1 Tax=Halosquirtibacter xylanolyticus TaxID=3374599 RepID=UPI003748EDF3|nr:hypothetical protein K5X82_03270 [Prolixibacteraceae bacterium]